MLCSIWDVESVLTYLKNLGANTEVKTLDVKVSHVTGIVVRTMMSNVTLSKHQGYDRRGFNMCFSVNKCVKNICTE